MELYSIARLYCITDPATGAAQYIITLNELKQEDDRKVTREDWITDQKRSWFGL